MSERVVAHEVYLWETVARSAFPASLCVLIGLLAARAERIWWFGGAVVVFALSCIIAAPTVVWLDGKQLGSRRLGRTDLCELDDVVAIDLYFITWAGNMLRLKRRDGTAFLLSNLGRRTALLRVHLGNYLEASDKVSMVEAEAREYLGLA